MVRTHTTRQDGQPPAPPARAARGRGHGRGHGRGRGAARTAAGEVPADPPVVPDQDQIPVNDAPAQAPPVSIVIPGLQEALAQILIACTGLAQAVSISTAAATSQVGGGTCTQSPVARTPEQVVQELQTPGAPPAQPVLATQDYVVPAMPEDVISIGWRGSTYSYVSSYFAHCMDMPCESLVSSVYAQHIVEKGCLSYLAFVRDVSTETPAIDSVPVVYDFSDVFPADLSSMSPDRDIDFGIDLVPGTQPVSIPPYRMAPAELK
ncbi:uncharacterized protein [Nicotiana tomentosiformis]|uniref:uncharacterized protein n=1 Tax=Nicotiana tomentosiformis TaxID=4098 RepID=UPI00388CC232